MMMIMIMIVVVSIVVWNDAADNSSLKICILYTQKN